jgi:hypothetical protein
VFSITTTKTFDSQFADLYSSHPRVDEIKKAIHWMLTRNPKVPDSYEIAPGYVLWVTTQLPVKTIPKVRIFVFNRRNKSNDLTDVY